MALKRRARPLRRRTRRLERRAKRLTGRFVRPSVAHLIVPGFARWLELRWRLRIRRAPTTTPERHALAVADPDRRGSAIERPLGCALCGGTEIQELLHPFDKRKQPRWNYHVVRCTGCGFLYRHPGIVPERLGELYATGRYAKFLGGKYTDKRIQRYEVAMAPFGRLLSEGAGRRLLDFGCGNGLFLDIAHERGFACHGVDLAADAIEVARTRPGGTRTYCGSPEEIPEIAAGGFDVITMWSVLAHIAEPVEDIAMLRRLLAPDGVLLVLTVNAGSLKLKRQLERWDGFTPNHLVFFSPRTLPLLMRRAGFAAIVSPPWYGEPLERGTSPLGPWAQRRARRTIDRGNRGNMLRAVAFASPDGPRRWGLDGTALAPSTSDG